MSSQSSQVVVFAPAQLPVPASVGGLSAAVDVRACSGSMTFLFGGNPGDGVVVEGGPDGTKWGDLVELTANREVQSPPGVVVGFVRLRRTRVDPVQAVTPQVSAVAQPPPGYTFAGVSIPVPAGDGAGASVNVGGADVTVELQVGSAKAILTSAFDAADRLTLQASADGNPPWVPVMELLPGKILSLRSSLAWLRVVRSRVPSAGPRVGVDGATATFLGQSFTGVSNPNLVYALKLLGPEQTNVQHDVFWVANQVLGNLMFWRMWIKNQAPVPDGYVISDGYGGAHAILLSGFSSGNIWNGAASVSFGADDGIPNDQWFEMALAIGNDWAGNPYIVVFNNGIPVGCTPMVGTRTAPAGVGAGTGFLFVGGSSHINWSGEIAQLCAYDTTSPLGANAVMLPFVPERRYSASQNEGFAGHIPDLFVDYTRPSPSGWCPDDSDGYDGGTGLGPRIKHPGRVFNIASNFAASFPTQRPPDYPLASWVVTADGHPWTADAEPTPPGGRTFVVPPTPVGAKIFDSFSRQDQTYAYSNLPSLGSTESGSLGPKVWQQSLFPSNLQPVRLRQWGIFNGMLVNLGYQPTVAWVLSNSPDMTVRVSNRLGVWGNGNTGLAFRVVDGDNFWILQYTNTPGVAAAIALAKVVAGVVTGMGSTPLAPAEMELKVVCAGDNIQCFVNNVDPFGGAIVDADLDTAVGAGVALLTGGNVNIGLSRYRLFSVT